MDEIAPEYDVLVLGTGASLPRQCHRRPVLTPHRPDGMRPFGVTQTFPADRPVLTEHSVLSVQGKKVLHIDRNDHYGGYVMQRLLISRADMLI